MNTKALVQIMIFLISILTYAQSQEVSKHVFILSGQSNMSRLVIEESFKPTLEAEFGSDSVLIVKDDFPGAPMRRWYSATTSKESSTDLYDRLWGKIKDSLTNVKIVSATFVWMQGERDAREKLGENYDLNLLSLYLRLSNELNYKKLNFVIGRLNDFDLENTSYPHWEMVRNAQMNVANSNPLFDWIDTDDLNDGINRNGDSINNDIHMSKDGYEILGKRFALKAIELIGSN